MDIDSWTSEMRPHSDPMSYSSGGQGQPPSIGDVRQIEVSQHSGSCYQIYSFGQPPSLSDVGRREPSQGTCYEGHDAHEVHQPHIWKINQELLEACDESLVNIPADGTHVAHTPQGHSEELHKEPGQQKMAQAYCLADVDGYNIGSWSVEEDLKLISYIEKYGRLNWHVLPKLAGVSRSEKSCRARWMNYLGPNAWGGNFRKDDDVFVANTDGHL